MTEGPIFNPGGGDDEVSVPLDAIGPADPLGVYPPGFSVMPSSAEQEWGNEFIVTTYNYPFEDGRKSYQLLFDLTNASGAFAGTWPFKYRYWDGEDWTEASPLRQPTPRASRPWPRTPSGLPTASTSSLRRLPDGGFGLRELELQDHGDL